MPNPVSSQPITTSTLDRTFTRADVEFHGVDHSGPSYEGRVYLNTPAADESTGLAAAGYAGSFYIFGHGGCLGDAGHCDVLPRRRFDPRPAHPLTPIRKVVIATAAISRALESDSEELIVTVVPVITSTSPEAGRPDDLLHYQEVRIVTYR
jgi:hypothetical protein